MLNRQSHPGAPICHFKSKVRVGIKDMTRNSPFLILRQKQPTSLQVYRLASVVRWMGKVLTETQFACRVNSGASRQ